jgi:protein-S-isoprenylcysteine O-methyltransferase Ste14
MIAKHTVLTILVAAAAISVGWVAAPVEWTPLRLCGLLLALVSFIMWTVARFQLGSSFTITAQAKHLVTRGLYRRIRNPIYVFGSLFLVGCILLMGWPILLLVFLVIIPMQLRRARKEATVLEAKFGDDYLRYRAGTWF